MSQYQDGIVWAEGRIEAAANGNRPLIAMADYAHAAEEAIEAIKASNDPRSYKGFIGWNEGVFQRLMIRGGAPVAQPMDATMLQVRLSEVARFTGSEDKPLQVPAAQFARYISAIPEVDLPPINRVVDVPVFTEDGELTKPGYNAGGGGVFYIPKFRTTGIRWSKKAADQALAFIKEDLLGDFIFDGEADFAHALCIMLQPFVRDLIKGPTPLYPIDAPTAGSGKGLLAACLAMPAMGVLPASPEAESPAEWRKRITTALVSGRPFLLIDNVNEKMDAGTLAAAVTADVWNDRLLGGNTEIDRPNRATWVLTGNNLAASAEIVRRGVSIRIHPHGEHPEEYTGFEKEDLKGWASENRQRLIRAALTVCMRWVREGRPPGSKSLGSFESWARVMSGILETNGVGGFLDNREQFRRAADENREPTINFLRAWWDDHPGELVYARELANEDTGLDEELFQALRITKSSEALGKWLRKKRDTTTGGYMVKAQDDGHGTMKWRLKRVDQ